MAVSFSGWVSAVRDEPIRVREPLDCAPELGLVLGGEAESLAATAVLADERAGLEDLLGLRT
jgi:hypothetical protein